MNIGEELSSKYSACLSSRCKDKGCTVKLDEISNDNVILSGKLYQSKYKYRENLCDFMVLDQASNDPIKIALLELKNGNVNEREFDRAYNQLKNGASVANNLTKSANINDFAPRLVKSGTLNSMASRLLNDKKYMVNCHGISKYIRTMHCGASLIF